MYYEQFRDPKLVKVKKVHRCIWCPELIKVGESAMRTVGKFDGNIQDDRYHPECYLASQELDWRDLEEGFEPQSFERGSTEEAGSAERALYYAALDREKRNS